MGCDPLQGALSAMVHIFLLICRKAFLRFEIGDGFL
jgi:hypothetical protein